MCRVRAWIARKSSHVKIAAWATSAAVRTSFSSVIAHTLRWGHWVRLDGNRHCHRRSSRPLGKFVQLALRTKVGSRPDAEGTRSDADGELASADDRQPGCLKRGRNPRIPRSR